MALGVRRCTVFEFLVRAVSTCAVGFCVSVSLYNVLPDPAKPNLEPQPQPENGMGWVSIGHCMMTAVMSVATKMLCQTLVPRSEWPVGADGRTVGSVQA